MEPRVSSIEQAEVVIQGLHGRVLALEQLVADHVQRFDTLQTPWWKRWWFWIDGWPWHDLNAPARRWRPWHQPCAGCENPRGRITATLRWIARR